ncbi:MAG: DUF6297 family protein [Nocardioidaceae bacterium]
MSSTTAELRGLRQQIRVWRRGRADTRLIDAVSDAYIALFATAMLTSMAVSVVVNVRSVAGDACSSVACTDARAALPWLFGVSLVAGTLGVSRLFGPLLVSPAVATWLLPTPVDRRALLRNRLAGTGAVAVLLSAVLSAGAATLAGFPASEVVSYAGCVAATCLLAVGAAAVCQAARSRVAQALTWLLAAAVWAGLLLLTFDAVPAGASASRVGTGWWVAVAFLVVVALVAAQRAYAGLPRLGRDQLTPGGSLVPGLSGALASLDFALVYDVLVARHWRSRSTVRVVRGRGLGPSTLVWREVVRLRRTPQVLVVLAGSSVLPYLGATLGLGRADLLVATTTGFLASIGMFSSLRVLSRTPSLVRCLPLTPAQVRTACLSVPAAVVLVWALAGVPAIGAALHAPTGEAVALGLAVGVTAVTAVVRWVTGRPPDYQLPLVTSPMGAVPTSLYVSAARGFDALLLGSAPLLIVPTLTGAEISIGLDLVVLAILLNRK